MRNCMLVVAYACLFLLAWYGSPYRSHTNSTLATQKVCECK